jgi:hypothetical protein
MIPDIAGLSTKEYRSLQTSQELARWTEKFKFPAEMFWPTQTDLSSKRKGDLWEDLYREKCNGLGPRINKWHDATLCQQIVDDQGLRGNRIEIKYTNIAKKDSAKDIETRGFRLESGERAKQLTHDDKEPGGIKFVSGGSFQQIHPYNADYGLFSAVFANGAVHYWVPYHLISNAAGAKNAESGKIPLASMHHGATVEGQIGRPIKFHNLFLLDVTWGTPFILDLATYNLKKYENLCY